MLENRSRMPGSRTVVLKTIFFHLEPEPDQGAEHPAKKRRSGKG